MLKTTANPLPRTDISSEDREALQNKMINEEYKIWKKNSVFLYDIMYRCAVHIILPNLAFTDFV